MPSKEGSEPLGDATGMLDLQQVRGIRDQKRHNIGQPIE
jgi:hypothetical protein